MSSLRLVAALGLLQYGIVVHSVQPEIQIIEGLPARRSAGVTALPEGSPWCNGLPTAWFPGHKNFLEDRPSCLVNGEWSQQRPHGHAVMDIIDDLNARDDPKVIDRHDCGTMDINGDGLLDFYCMVGANAGTGDGFNELYLTQTGGFLFKIRRHALQRFRSLRTRHTTTLKGADGSDLVLLTASHGERADGRVNKHSMFRRNGSFKDDWKERYFDYVDGPWHDHSINNCALTIDANGDGLDDVLLCNEIAPGWLFLQNDDGSFENASWDATQYPTSINWRNARVADLTGDGIPDLAVVYAGKQKSRLSVFRGIREAPYFEFNQIFYTYLLPFAAPDLEIVDVDGDGKNDMYVVQVDEAPVDNVNKYCAGRLNFADWWPVNATSRQTPPDDWVPPNDAASDMLFLGAQRKNDRRELRFRAVPMQHSLPGCGYYVKKFHNNSLLLAQGGFDRPGYQLYLDWS